MLGIKHAEAIGELGGTPVLVDRDAGRLAAAVDALRGRTPRVDAESVVCDITDAAAVRAMVEQLVERFAHIDILINNAALTVKGGGSEFDDYFAAFEEYPERHFELALRVNLTGAFLVTQAVGARMASRGLGVILNIASDVALISPDHRIYQGMTIGPKKLPFNTPVAYSMSKAALLAFTRYLATYWAARGIRVNSLSPAGVFDDHEPAFVQRLSQLIPLGRMADRDEYKGAIAFLCSDASSFMTGANVVIDGGRTIW